MVNKDKFNKGHKRCKKLEGGIHENNMLVRKALNEICEITNIEIPESLKKLNEAFEK